MPKLPKELSEALHQLKTMDIRTIKDEKFVQIIDEETSIVRQIYITCAKRSKFTWMEHLSTVQSFDNSFSPFTVLRHNLHKLSEIEIAIQRPSRSVICDIQNVAATKRKRYYSGLYIFLYYLFVIAFKYFSIILVLDITSVKINSSCK